MNTTQPVKPGSGAAWKFGGRQTTREKVRAAILRSLGLDDTAPAAGDTLGARYARRIGVPVLQRPRPRAVWRTVPNRAERRAESRPGRTRTAGYAPRTSPKVFRPSVPDESPRLSKRIKAEQQLAAIHAAMKRHPAGKGNAA